MKTLEAYEKIYKAQFGSKTKLDKEFAIIKTALKRLEWYDTYYTDYVKDLEKSNHKLNDIRVEREKHEIKNIELTESKQD